MSHRVRIHVGWRVVREREVDGVKVREWWHYYWERWTVDPWAAHTYGSHQEEFVREDAKDCGGRVVRVFLSYGRGR